MLAPKKERIANGNQGPLWLSTIYKYQKKNDLCNCFTRPYTAKNFASRSSAGELL
jgi:hypothetical protein